MPVDDKPSRLYEVTVPLKKRQKKRKPSTEMRFSAVLLFLQMSFRFNVFLNENSSIVLGNLLCTRLLLHSVKSDAQPKYTVDALRLLVPTKVRWRRQYGREEASAVYVLINRWKSQNLNCYLATGLLCRKTAS